MSVFIPGLERESKERDKKKIAGKIIVFVLCLLLFGVLYYFTQNHNNALREFFSFMLWGLWWVLDLHGIEVVETIKFLCGSAMFSIFIAYIVSALKKGRILDALMLTGRFFTITMVLNLVIFIAGVIHYIFFVI